jgi:hypothetical protein
LPPIELPWLPYVTEAPPAEFESFTTDNKESREALLLLIMTLCTQYSVLLTALPKKDKEKPHWNELEVSEPYPLRALFTVTGM